MARTCSLAAALLLALLPSLGAAAPIAVTNPSFESPDLVDGGKALTLNPDVTTISGWGAVYSGSGVPQGGVHDPQDAQYAGSNGDGSALPSPADQGQAAWLKATVSGDTQSLTTLANVATVQDDTTYTLTVAVGNPLDFDPGDVQVQILVNGAVEASGAANDATLPEGQFTDVMAVLTTGSGDPLTGGQIKLRVFHSLPVTGERHVHFDNVLFESTAAGGVCGDGGLDAGEECDDGNTAPGDGCDESCVSEICGNGVLQSGEECDDSNTAGGDGCDTNCILEICGNGVLQPPEECDDGNTIDGDGCTGACAVPEPTEALLLLTGALVLLGVRRLRD